MADDIDKANDLAELERVAAIRAITARPALAYCGRCRNCDEPIEQGAYCSAECATDAQKRERFNAR
jgi:hypothetical protein